MFDFGFLTLPFIGAAAVFGLALFTGDAISINKIAVPTHLEAKGLNDVVVTRHLTDEIRELNIIAGSDLERSTSTAAASINRLASWRAISSLSSCSPAYATCSGWCRST